MRKQILVGAAVLALAAAMATSAMASNHKTGHGGSRATHIHASGTYGWGRHDRGYAAQGGNAYSEGGYKNLGPLGTTFGCGRATCGQGYSVSAWSY